MAPISQFIYFDSLKKRNKNQQKSKIIENAQKLFPIRYKLYLVRYCIIY